MKSAGNALVEQLQENQDKIENSKPWKDLSQEGQIERLRTYFKKALKQIRDEHAEELTVLKNQIARLEVHKHNDKGYPIVEQTLGEPSTSLYSDNPQGAQPHLLTTIGVPNDEAYI